MLKAIFKSFIYCVPLFFFLLLAIGFISSLYSKISKFLSAILGLALGGSAVYVSLKVVSYFHEDPIFHWYYFVLSAFVIGPMNNGNLNPDTTESAKWVGTNVLGGAVLTEIIFLFIF